jgi:hypothetical protein
MIQPSEETVFRLLLAKSLLDPTRTHSVAEPDSFFLAQQLLRAHDAAELVMAAVAQHCQARTQENYLMLYVSAVEKKTEKAVDGKEHLSQMSQARNGLKHYGNLPNEKQWVRVTEKVYEYAEKWCREFLDIDLATLDQSALLQLSEVRQLYADAETKKGAGDYQGALESLGKALHVVFEENAALRGLHAGVPRSEDAIKLAGYGVHGNDYLALQEFLPTINEDKETGELTPQWEQTELGHPGNWRKNAVEFCLRAFLDIALKIQNASWIPGAIEFEALYEYKVTALRPVDVLGDLPVDGESGGEVLRSLREGESIAAKDVKVQQAGSSLRSLLAALNPPLGAFGSQKSWPPYLEVLLRDDFRRGYITPPEAVAVTCVPRDSEAVKRYFPELPEIPWQPKAAERRFV